MYKYNRIRRMFRIFSYMNVFGYKGGIYMDKEVMKVINFRKFNRMFRIINFMYDTDYNLDYIYKKYYAIINKYDKYW